MKIDRNLNNNFNLENFNVIPENSRKITTTPFMPLTLREPSDSVPPLNLENKKLAVLSTEDNYSSQDELLQVQQFLLGLFTSTFNFRDEEYCKKDFIAFQKKIDDQFRKIQNITDFGENFKKTLKYLHINQDNFLGFTKAFLSDEDYEIVDQFFNTGYDAIKHSDSIFHLLKESAESYLASQALKEIQELERKHSRVLQNDKEQLCNIRRLRQDLSFRLKTSLKTAGYKLFELCIFRIFPLVIVSLIKIFHNVQLVKIFKEFFRIYKIIFKVRDFKINYIKKKKWVNDLKPKINITLLFQETFNQHSRMLIYKTLEEKHKDFETKVNKSIRLLEKLHEENSHLDFLKFTSVLKKHGFNLNFLDHPPTSKQEWMESFQDEKFKETLCARNVEFQMTVAKMVQQGLQIVISEKINLENNFLIFDLIKNIALAVSTLFQIVLFIPKCAVFLAEWGIDQIKKNLPVPGIEAAFILNPDLELSLIGLVYLSVSHLFGAYHKPNEYSIKGYWVDLLNKVAQVGYNVQYIIFFIMKSSFQLTDMLIDFCMQNHKNSAAKARSYQRLNERMTENRRLYQNRLESLEKQMNVLKEKDIKQTLNPKITLGKRHQLFILKKYLADNRFPKKLLKEFDAQLKQKKQLDKTMIATIDKFLTKHRLLARDKVMNGESIYQFDQIQIMISAMSSAEISLFPEDVKNFFKKNLNLQLGDQNPDLQEKMRKFFLSSNKSFFKFFQETREKIPAVKA